MRLLNILKKVLIFPFKVLIFFFKLYTWPYWLYRFYVNSVGKTLCPNCYKWTVKEIINKQFLGEGTTKVLKSDVHFIRKGYYNQERERFEHEYYIDKKVNVFKVTYNCNCCNKPFTINEEV